MKTISDDYFDKIEDLQMVWDWVKKENQRLIDEGSISASVPLFHFLVMQQALKEKLDAHRGSESGKVDETSN